MGRTMAHLLLVEDEAGIADILQMAMGDAGHRMEHAPTLTEARRLLARSGFDAILLDLSLPDGNGIELCREVRATSTVPILILTARRSEIDRVLGLELGADDYVVKPFSPREVAARVAAVLRRRSWERHGSSPQAAPVRSGALELDPGRREVRVAGVPVALTRTEFDLLTALLERPGVVRSRQQLIDAVWDGAFIQDRVVDSVVSRLRRKLGSDAPEIRTVHGVGYALGG